jgi:MscS family membrane protein
LLNIVKNLPRWFFLTIEIYVPLRVLNLPENVDFAINVIFLFVVILQIIKIISKVLIFSLSNVFKSKNDKKDKTAQKTIEMIVNIVVWVIGILMFLTNIGVNLTPLVASL